MSKTEYAVIEHFGEERLQDAQLKPELGFLSAVFLVIGGMVGVGIFVNPSTAALSLQSPLLDVVAWLVGGAIAILGAFVYAELAARMPATGGEYVYLKNTLGSFPAFLFGWTTFLVVQAGSLAAASIIFARSLRVLTDVGLGDGVIILILLSALAALNCAGVPLGNIAQLTLGAMKILVLAAVVFVGFGVVHPHLSLRLPLHRLRPGRAPENMLRGFAIAMVPILFTFGGWQTANYMGGEIKNSRRVLSMSLIIGVTSVVIIYSAVNLAFLNAFGLQMLGETTKPTSDLLMLRFGPVGEKLAAAAVAISALGFLSQSIMTGPRIYLAMARDGLFFANAAEVNKSTGTPARAILMQVGWAAILALSNTFSQLLSYVVSVNFLFFALSASTLFIFRARHDDAADLHIPRYKVPLHPWTTIVFIAACLGVVGSAVLSHPVKSFTGFGIMALGIGPYIFWQQRSNTASPNI